MKHLCIWLIRLYQKYLSPLKSRPTCRFTPTCSQYAIEAYQKRGFFVGSILTAWRILRCNPFCPGGYDPVPEKGFSNKNQREEYMKKLDEMYPDGNIDENSDYTNVDDLKNGSSENGD